MCIRDRAGKTLTLYVYDVDSNQQTLYDINTGISVAVEKRSLNSVTATPVSYTHLDVYKRQLLHRSFAHTLMQFC